MSGDEVIDLLSDDEEFGRSSNAKARSSGKSPIALTTNCDEVTILSDTEGDVNIRDKPSHQSQSLVVHNPYAKGTIIAQTHMSGSHKDDVCPNKPQSNVCTKEIHNPYEKKRKKSNSKLSVQLKEGHRKSKQPKPSAAAAETGTELQSGLVFEEDINHIQPNIAPAKKAGLKQASIFGKKSSLRSDDNEDCDEALISAAVYVEHQTKTRISRNLQPILYHDTEFTAGNPATIDGIHVINKSSKKSTGEQSAANDDFIVPPAPKCRCRPAKPCLLGYSKKGNNIGRPYYKCQSNSCKYFSWAFTSYMLHWYRFGAHNGHCLVKPNRGFRAEDLVQGKVGDCWFLSALAVVAEREDLIYRLIGANSYGESDKFGAIDVTLFVDGYWKKIVMDNFLPCFIEATNEKKEQDDIKQALQQSLVASGMDSSIAAALSTSTFSQNDKQTRVSSRFDPNVISDKCRTTLNEIHEFLHYDRFNKYPSYRSSTAAKKAPALSSVNRKVSTSDLAYSKAKQNQLWVPFIEKAYAKMHGSYKAISGGHVAEAFLDLTGAPTAVYNFDHHDFNPRRFWGELMSFRRKKLPMGCGTTSSQEGIVGMHAYSILDVREVKNVGAEFFYDKKVQGNVSGFTDLDGTVRLLRIRNPHGQGEWKGEFSDKSTVWHKLLQHKNGSVSSSHVDLTKPISPELERTMKNDGTFWIGYDDFLMGFSNVDVVLAFRGNHAKSFSSNFPPKPSNHRCYRAFKLSTVGAQPGESEFGGDDIEVYVMCIQKTRRGASHGRADRKKSYKACDIGILVGEAKNDVHNEEPVQLEAVDGRFFGLTRNGHIRLMLSRTALEKKLIVMPVSFGHPAATDEALSFVVRFVSNAPLLVKELAKPPKMNIVMQKFCFGSRILSLGIAGTSHHRGLHGEKTLIYERKLGGAYLFRIFKVECLSGGGGTVLFYLAVNDTCLSLMSTSQQDDAMSFALELNCRGMSCRSADGIEKHEVVAKGKKFEAAWRRFSIDFRSESKSRLLCVLVQSGQDFQVGSIKCKPAFAQKMIAVDASRQMKLQDKDKYICYDEYGIFASSETPPDLEPLNGYQHVMAGELMGSSEADNEMALALQRSREEYQAINGKADRNEVITICDSFDSDNDDQVPDHDLDSAIMASMEGRAASNSSEDEDLKKAIELSLKSI